MSTTTECNHWLCYATHYNDEIFNVKPKQSVLNRFMSFWAGTSTTHIPSPVCSVFAIPAFRWYFCKTYQFSFLVYFCHFAASCSFVYEFKTVARYDAHMFRSNQSVDIFFSVADWMLCVVWLRISQGEKMHCFCFIFLGSTCLYTVICVTHNFSVLCLYLWVNVFLLF